MKRVFALIFILLISLSFIAENVKAEQVEYESFDGLRFYFQDVGQEGPVTVSFNLPSQKCVAGVVVQNAYGDPDELRVKVNGITLSDDNYMSAWPTQEICSDTFSVEVEAYNIVEDPPEVVEFTIERVGLIVDDEYKKVKSRLLDLKYIPPGAENTAQGFILNQTEVYLKQSYTLPEGSISFWLRWDGSTGIKISDNIGIDSNGYLYVKNSEEITYTFEGVNPPTGTYIPVYFAWSQGSGYIVMNNTVLNLNWEGNFTITKVGDLSTQSATIVDEFKLWEFTIYSLSDGVRSFDIYPEGGTTLPSSITATALNGSLEPLSSIILTPQSPNQTIPTNTQYILLSTGNVERLIYIGNLTDAIIAFPSTSVSALSTVRVQIPAGYDLLEIQTLQGYYVLRLPMTDTIATFTAVTGAYYLFSATDYDTNSTITTVKQVISDVITLVPSNITPSVSIEEGEQLYYEYNPGTNDAVVVYTAPSPKNITMNYVLYDNKGDVATNVTYTYSDVQMKVWHFSFPLEYSPSKGRTPITHR